MQVILVLIFALWLCKSNLTLFICHLQNQLSSYPDMAAYHCIAVTLGQAGLVKELFDVIDCMRSPPRKKFKLSPLQNWDPRLEPDLIVYNAVSNICSKFHVELPNWIVQTRKQESSNTLVTWSSVAHNYFYLFAGFECLCATKAMGRGILGTATVEREEHLSNKFNIRSCYGGTLILMLHVSM